MSVVASLLGFQRNWVLSRLQDPFSLNRTLEDRVEGQFHAEGLTEEIASEYSEKFALNRQNPLTQFLHGNTETITFTGRLFAARAFIESVDNQLNLLKSWVRRDFLLERPPLLSFTVGDGHVQMEKCFLQSLSGITYERPTAFGALRHVTFTVNLRKFTDFELPKFQLPGVGAVLGAVAGAFGDTRFHTAKRGDYYESLTQLEYDDALLGDLIRRRNPDKPNIQIGDVIALPTASTIQGQQVTQQSVPLKTAFDRPPTPQRNLRIDIFKRRDRKLLSFVL